MEKILFLEWKSFGNEHIVPVFEGLGYRVVMYPFALEKKDARMSEELAADVAKTILKEQPAFVFSFNYFPTAAIACKACKVRYVSWIYDSPYIMA
nr:hypothetical protein [Lachnospiraceae bacterium]